MTTENSPPPSDGINWAGLSAPFPASQIKWRIADAKVGNDGKIKARCLAYVDRTDVKKRLDECVGPENWQTAVRHIHGGSFLFGIGIQVNGEWIWRWDGGENDGMESFKGGISDSFKRAATQWGISLYLSELKGLYPQIVSGRDGQYNSQTNAKNASERKWFSWNPPKLPSWALPENERGSVASKPGNQAGSSADQNPELDRALVGIRGVASIDRWVEAHKYTEKAFANRKKELKICRGALDSVADEIVGKCQGKQIDEVCQQVMAKQDEIMPAAMDRWNKRLKTKVTW